MKQSDKLRENKNQHIVKNKESKIQDVKIKNVVDSVLLELKIKYPHLQFGIDKKKMLHDIEHHINDDNYTTSPKSYITPDGGLLWVKINNQKHYILVSEQKRQGTNDKRRVEGKGKQSKGNAGERLGKFTLAMRVFFGDEDICPSIAFLQGCDFFDEESTIGDRIRTIAQFQQINVINLEWRQIQKHNTVGGSYFMRGHSMNDDPGTSDWSFDEMFNPMFTIAEKALNYFLVKYGE